VKLAVLQLSHPAFILRGQFGRRQSQLHALRRLRRWLDTGIDGPEPLTPPPIPNPWPTAAEITSWLYSLERTSPEGVAVDVEAAGPHIRLIGFARVSDEAFLPVTIRDVGGAIYYSRADLERIVRATYWTLANPRIPKIFHNGFSYDIPQQLEEVGFVVNNYAGDTLLMQRYAYPEAPAELLYCGIHYGKLGSWKHWVRVKPEEENENK
jgi:hypothetical protein